MYNQPFYIPGYYGAAIPNMARGAMMPARALSGGASLARGGLFGRLGNAFGALKAFNWGGLINNTSKTLGIINQTIPLVRQVGPMIGNVRSMMRVASIFKDETDSKSNSSNTSANTSNTNVNNSNGSNNTNNNITNNITDNKRDNINTNNRSEEKESQIMTNNSFDSPTFFI